MLKVQILTPEPLAGYNNNHLFHLWKDHSGQSICFCTVKNCLNRDLTGALIKIAGNTQHIPHIIPMCTMHANMNKEVEITLAFQTVPFCLEPVYTEVLDNQSPASIYRKYQ